MKKLIAFIIILTLTQFQISIEPREAQAQSVIAEPSKSHEVKTYTHVSDGMTYKIFVLGSDYADLDIEVVNVTKDKLEVERLQLEIARLKRLK